MKQKGDKSAATGSKAKAVDEGLENLSAEEKCAELLRRLQETERQRLSLQDQAKENDALKRANGLLDKKLERQNNLLLKTEESKAKLEELCRELQKYNKEIREDGVKRMKGMEEERAQAVEKLRLSLKDIELTMQEGHGKSDQLAADNARLATSLSNLATEYQQKLVAISDQHDKKEVYWGELVKAKDAEIALLAARLEASQLEGRKATLEREELTRSLLEGTARVGGAIESEKQLREQVREYSEKYSSLSKSLSASNEAFDRFKRQIDKVNNKLSKVEAESNKWKLKYEEANKVILVLTMQKKECEEAVEQREKKVKTLEALCRSLTARGTESATANAPIDPDMHNAAESQNG